MISTARKLVYDFFSLPYVVRTNIAIELHLCSADDLQLSDSKLWSLIFANLCERGSLTSFKDRIAAEKDADTLKGVKG